VIQALFKHAESLRGRFLKVVYLEDYDIGWGKLMTSGVDLWLNTPQKPLEASGTSGMKAALNGVPSLSVLDGWWVEGCLEGTTGWAVGGHCGPVSDPDEAESLYCKLGQIATMFYEHPGEYHTIMRAAIAINGSFFNSQRMLSQYVANAYCPIRECASLPTISSRSAA
jgi:glycogen phosphorylase